MFARSPGNGDFDGILCFYRNADKTMWVGTNSGLYLLDESGSISDRITADDGLPSSVVYGIVSDDIGRLWLSTNRGIASVETRGANGYLIRAYNESHGIRNREFNRQAYLKASDGTVFFGGDKGLTFFKPESIIANRYAPAHCDHRRRTVNEEWRFEAAIYQGSWTNKNHAT